MLPDTHALGLDPGRLDTALTAACRAPSLHNSQPWRFRVGPDVIELWADPERVLAAADPEGREQRMACGAALLTLRLALRGFGVLPTVTVLPDRARPDLIAEVRRGGERPPSPEELRLLAAVPRRHTNRRPFADAPVTAGELTALQRAALDEGAWLHVVDDPTERVQVAELAVAAAQGPARRPGVRRRAQAVDGRHGGARRRRARHRGRSAPPTPGPVGAAGLRRLLGRHGHVRGAARGRRVTSHLSGRAARSAPGRPCRRCCSPPPRTAWRRRSSPSSSSCPARGNGCGAWCGAPSSRRRCCASGAASRCPRHRAGPSPRSSGPRWRRPEREPGRRARARRGGDAGRLADRALPGTPRRRPGPAAARRRPPRSAPACDGR